MNKWLQNQLFLRILALVIAIILWISANNVSLPFLREELTVKPDVTVHVEYDKSLYDVVDSEKFRADLYLSGVSVLYQYLANYWLYVDLTHCKAPGVYRLPVQVKGLPPNIKYEVKPRTVSIKLEAKNKISTIDKEGGMILDGLCFWDRWN